MAQRYGGKYSPTSARGADDPASDGFPGVAPGRELRQPQEPAHPLSRRPYWLIAAAVPFLFSAFSGGPEALVRGLGAFALIASAAFLVKEGLRAEAAWQARSAARRPLLPRKILGAIAFGLGLGIGAGQSGVAGAVVIGAVGFVLDLLAFGLDPMKDKGMEGIDGIQQDRAARAVAEGEKHLSEMRDAIRRANDIALSDRVERFTATARVLFRAVEQDPGDFAAARRYMGVYLIGARDATIKFVDLWTTSRDAQARKDYETLLNDLEANFSARTKDLIEGGREGLNIEIDVLRERLQREGVTPAPLRTTETDKV